MKRLIEAYALSKYVENSLYTNPHKDVAIAANHLTEHKHFMAMIDRQPTVSLEKTIIDKLAEKLDPNVDMDTGEHCNNWVVDMQNELISECIDIVKGVFDEYQGN